MRHSHVIETIVHHLYRRVAGGSGTAGAARGRGCGMARLGLVIGMALAALPSRNLAAGFDVRLRSTNAPGGIDVFWTSPSLTPSAPFVHYEFQVQHSAELSAWQNAVLIPGGFLGSASVPRTFRLPTTNAQGFVRLSYRLNMPGANLSGLDLSGADLRGANLAGANLSGTKLDGALLGGADLSGANLAGATFAGANLQDVNLTGFDLSGLDLSTILGMPSLSQVTANPLGRAAELVPNLPYNSDGRDLVANDPVVPGVVSTRHAMLMLKTNATVGQLNALLAARGAAIVASSPADATLPNAVLMARFPTASAQALLDLTESLANEPIIEAAAPDVLVGTAVVPEDSGAWPGWEWNLSGLASGGNWGLEAARVPQMWNILGSLQHKNAPRVPTCVIDVAFLPHVDLSFALQLGAVGRGTGDHGNHVAGTIGAKFDNGEGVDGVNPMASMIAYTFRRSPSDYPDPNLPLGTVEAGRQANAYSMIEDVRDTLRLVPSVRIINMSLCYNWYRWTTSTRPTISSPFTDEQKTAIEQIALKYGIFMAGVAYSSSSVLIVCAAGNDGRQLLPARVASPMATAALTFGAPNVLAVEAHNESGAACGFSNAGGHVAAPGTNILSASLTGIYSNSFGTSMAAPFVSGVAGFLLATAPTLTPTEIITLIQKNGANVDAYTSLLEIDRLPGRLVAHDREVLRMLLDIDDGSPDGSRRVNVPGATLTRERGFELVTGDDVDTNNLAHGDGTIDMSDFRRWRDWLLYVEGDDGLNGSVRHPKFDGNGDGTVEVIGEQFQYPRGDFNGDAVLDRSLEHPVPGYLRNTRTDDLGVLILSDLWEDACFTNAFELRSLINSVDFHVFATNFFYKHGRLTDETKVAAYHAATRAPLPGGGACLSPDEPVGVLTVPVGGPYYLASEPISLGGGTNVQMRTEGTVSLASDRRGADFAVDLTLREMTAVADTLNPTLRDIDSTPDTNRVEAYLGTSANSTNPPTVGVRASADEDATLHSIANSGSLPQPPDDPATNTTYSGAVRWQRTFTKDSDLRNPRFFLESLKLALYGSGPTTNELSAFAEFVLEIRAYDRSPAWEPVFIHHVEIAGEQASGLQPATFRIVGEEGDFPPRPLELIGTVGAEYEQKGKRTPIDLDGILDGHSFELRVRLNTLVRAGSGGENIALARLGDPLEYKSGFRMNYGRFGDLPLKKGVSRSAPAPAAGLFQAAGEPPAILEYLSKTNFYYRLYHGADADTDARPFAMKLGIDGDDTMIDPAPLLPNPTEEDYTLENQPIDQPLDFDGDGMNDVYELRRPSILNPLDAADAFHDPDGDGRSNLEEYLAGTNPQTPDSPPSSPTLDFPGLLVPSYPGGTLIDLNNDGLLDSAGSGLNVTLAHVGGTFLTETNSPLPGLRSFAADTAYLKLDGDAFPDAVVVDQLTNRLFAFRGVGDGTFTPLSNHEAISGPSRIVFGNLNGDALTDLALLSVNGRGADLHRNNGDGTLTRIATVTTNAYGTARGLALGDLNNDGRDDVVVGYAANAIVFFSTNGAAYGPAQPFPVGSSPESIAIADLNHDGRLDIVTVNRSSDDVSVLLANTSGGFLSQVRYPVGDMPFSLRLADLNSDTHLDAVLSLSSADYQVILPGLGNGAFGTLYTVPGGSTLRDVRDWNGDGKLDLVSTITGGGLVNLGHGDGTFDTRLQIVPSSTPPTLVTAVDFNGDGMLELVGAQTQANSIDIWEHAAVTGANRLLTSLPVGPWLGAYTTGDFNGDGRVDLAVLTQTNSFNPRGTNQVIILTNGGNFVFARAGAYPLDLRPNRIVTGDFNGDGALDLAADLAGGSFAGGSRMVSLLGNAAGGFQVGPPVAVGNTVSFVAPANADADSRDELVVRGSRLVGNTTENFLEIYALEVGGGWTNRQTLTSTHSIFSLQIASLNGDAYPDLALAVTETGTGIKSLRIHPGGPGGFAAEQVVASPVEFSSFTRLTDLNGDGLLDVVRGNTLYLGKSGGGFHPAQSVWIGAAGAQGVADFNRDGKADLLNGLSILLQK